MGKILVIKGADFSAVAVGTVTPITGKVTIKVVASPTAGGTVTGGGSYDAGTEVQITATAKSGYKFKQWNDGNTNATRTIVVASSVTYTATFEESSEVDITSQFTLESGIIVADSTNGNYGKSYTSSVSMCNKNFVDISAYNTLKVKMVQYAQSSGASGGLCFYSSANESSVIEGHFYLSGSASTMVEKTFAIPSGAKYVRLTVHSSMQSEFYAKAE